MQECVAFLFQLYIYIIDMQAMSNFILLHMINKIIIELTDEIVI